MIRHTEGTFKVVSVNYYQHWFSAWLQGDYRFSLVAMDEAGNEQKQFLVKNADGTEAAQTSYVWTVDRTPPNRPDITMQPRSPSSDPNPQFKFSPPGQ